MFVVPAAAKMLLRLHPLALPHTHTHTLSHTRKHSAPPSSSSSLAVPILARTCLNNFTQTTNARAAAATSHTHLHTHRHTHVHVFWFPSYLCCGVDASRKKPVTAQPAATPAEQSALCRQSFAPAESNQSSRSCSLSLLLALFGLRSLHLHLFTFCLCILLLLGPHCTKLSYIPLPMLSFYSPTSSTSPFLFPLPLPSPQAALLSCAFVSCNYFRISFAFSFIL